MKIVNSQDGSCCFIGVDIGYDSVRIAQLASAQDGLSHSGGDIVLVASGSENRPCYIEPGSGDWQRWAVEAIRNLTADRSFRGKDVIASMPSSELIIDHIKMPKTGFPADHKMSGTIIRYIPSEEDNVLVMITDRKKIDRHLAIYEKASLQIKAMSLWPVALTSTYTVFFGRRKTDLEAVVMLLDIEADCTNLVICRHKNLLFARSIQTGAKHLCTEEDMVKLLSELEACREQFNLIYRKARIERLVFLSSCALNSPQDGLSHNECESIHGTAYAIARQMQIPARIGDCLAAVKITSPAVQREAIAGEEQEAMAEINWAVAFGLSLSSAEWLAPSGGRLSPTKGKIEKCLK